MDSGCGSVSKRCRVRLSVPRACAAVAKPRMEMRIVGCMKRTRGPRKFWSDSRRSSSCVLALLLSSKKGSPYSITERRAPELIPVLGSQAAGDWVINPAVGCHYFPPGLQLPSQPLRGLLPVLLLGEQRHDGCEQFAYDCYPTASRLRFEPRPFCAWVQHANHSATEPPS